MPKPMHRSRSLRRLDRVTPKNKHVIHYKRKANSLPHCAICGSELNGIHEKGRGKTSSTNSRKFGGVLCASCTGNVIKLASRIEQGEMKLNDISVVDRAYVLQMISH
ncbi:MAG: 50S ribosomal protein L34e [Candidatus Micrarchaeota archaeon]|nr:50S ribosomal protein L34e [Candidatus Micrarchaeota archaeon]MDE1834121.1 50S ribosomal protein L34e [Candidatus Micrarchaeota archaeon]MDE1859036.1 50S ribosomal protein L34e [Candidatus Micrarchaeota archaeon]